ncbi:MAG: Ig-like domain-containing protein [Myxococcaceae bacterium]|nr:Ig-like domain-containing protein [Myxococcaceae bacterium]
MDGAAINAAGGPSFEVRFQADDGSKALKAISLTVDGTATPEPLPATIGDGSWTWALNPADDDVPHTLALHVVDDAGNACDAQVNVRVDLVAPTLVVTAPAEEPDPLLVGGLGVESLTFEGHATDGSSLPLNVTVDFDDGMGPREVQWAQEPAGDFVAEVPLALEDFVEHAVVIRAADAAGNATTLTRNVIVDRVAPKVAITFPTDGQKFNIADMAGNSNVVVTWTSSDGDSAFTTSLRILPDPTPFAVTGTSLPIPTQATDNGKTYGIELTATDRMGNKVTQQVAYSVDRVAPTLVSSIPANNARLVDANLTLTFSEPVTFQSGMTVFTPPVALPTQTKSTFTIPLNNYAVYTLTLPAGVVVDAYGNPSPSYTGSTFLTAPAAPNPSTFSLSVDATSSERFDAISDEDGVVSIVYRKPGGFVEFGEIDPQSGNYVAKKTVSAGSTSDFTISSHREVNTPQLTALRYRGFGFDAQNGTKYAATVDPNGAVSQVGGSSALAIVPFKPGCADDPGADFAYLDASGGLYRAGTLVENAPFEEASSIAGHHRNAWAAAGYDDLTLTISERRCYCFGWDYFCGFPSYLTYQISPADRRARLVYPGNGKFMLTTWYSLYDGKIREWCVKACGSSMICPILTPSESVRPLNENLVIAQHIDPNKILGAGLNSAGKLELRERVVDTGCFDHPWTVIATAPSSLTLSANVFEQRYVPVMFGIKPGVLYLDNSNTLRAWIP